MTTLGTPFSVGYAINVSDANIPSENINTALMTVALFVQILISILVCGMIKNYLLFFYPKL